MKFWISVFITIIAFQTKVFGQLAPDKTGNPPILNCVKNETSNQISIQWTAPLGIGACFEEYGVYIALNDKNGPYNKITAITQPSSGTMTFNPQTNGTVYVFLANEQSCNSGNTSIRTSDTLDNIVPQIAPIIKTVTVENGFPVIYWEPSKNPEVTEYAIYSSTDNFSTPIDTVKGRLSNFYVDQNHDATQSAGAYRIRSIEYCEDNKGLYSNITERYNTILLTLANEDICKRSVVLDWNGYNFHTERVQKYLIEYSIDGQAYQVKTEVNDSIRKYEFTDLTPLVNTCIRIVAELPNGEKSISNVACITSQSVPAVEDHYIQNITVRDDHVEIIYSPDDQVDLSEIALERSTNGNIFSVLASSVSIQESTIDNTYIIKDFSALTERTALYYKVSVKNTCNNKYSTLPAKTILLKGENLGLNNELTWDDFFIEENDIISYELFKIYEEDTILIQSDDAEGTFTETGVYSNNFFAELCYVVKATHRSIDPDRPTDVHYSYSNFTCLKPRPQAFVPNAFAPNGHNKIFKPILVFGSDINYSLTIFDRNGAKVFESTQPNVGWNGMNAQRNVALDSYIYHLQFTGLDGQTYRKTGFVVVVQ